MNAIGDLVRYRALLDEAERQQAQALVAPPGELRDGMLAEALAIRARALELERGAA